MAKQTAAQRREAEELARQERIAAAEKFKREEAPMLLLMTMARASDLGVDYNFSGPVASMKLTLKFSRYDERNENWVDEEELTLDSDQWAFERTVGLFDEIVRERAEKARKQELARQTYDKLSPEEREALGLKYRP